MNETQCPDCQKQQQRVAELEAHIEQLNRSHRRSWLILGVLPLLIAILGGASVTVWLMNEVGKARRAQDKANTDSEKALKTEEESKGKLALALAVREVMVGERDRALATAQEAKHTADDTQAVLTFFQTNFFSVSGRPASWSKEGLGKNVTLRQAVDAAEAKVAGAFPEKPLVEASVREIIGSTYEDLGETDKAIKQYERSLALREAVSGTDDPNAVVCRNKLAVAYRIAGRTREAGRLYEQDPESPSRAAALAVQGTMLLTQKKFTEAELKLRQCLTIRKQIQPNDWTTSETEMLLGVALLDQEKYADAEPFLKNGYEGLKNHVPQDKSRLTKALDYLVRLYTAWDKHEKAVEWEKELEKTKAAK